MGALTIGTLNSMWRDSRVTVWTSLRERTVDLLGIKRTSSKVKPSMILPDKNQIASFIFNGQRPDAPQIG